MHIVIVEDNSTLAKSIKKMLTHEGYAITCFDNGAEAHTWLSHNQTAYDLIILDVLLPEMNGFEISKSLRRKSNATPILMLTSKDQPEDIVEGLDSGADDYLKKPFLFEELLARIRSLSRRQPHIAGEYVELTPDIVIDLLAHKVFKEKKEVHLTAKEFSILSFFLKHPNQVLTQQQLYDHVFDFAEVQLSNTIEVHIKNLRKKLKTAFDLPIITVKNAGYRLEYEK